MALEISIGNSKLFLLVVYRPPKVGFFSDLESVLYEYCSIYSNVIVLGDFNTNFNSLHCPDKTYLNDLIFSLNLINLPLKSTHFTSTSNSWIDLIIVSESLKQQISKHGQFSVPFLSAHDLIYLQLDITCPVFQTKIINYRNFKNINYENFHNEFAAIDFSDVFREDNINKKIETLNSFIIKSIDRHAPIKTLKIKKPATPWLTDKIKNLIRERDSVKRRAIRENRIDLFEEFRQLRNKVTQSVKNAKNRYYRNLFNNTKDSGSLWKLLKTVNAQKSTPKNAPFSRRK